MAGAAQYSAVCPVSIFAEEQAWLDDPRSFDGSLLTMSITLPELDGATTPMAIAAQFRDSTGLRVFRALPQRLERFADLVQRSVASKPCPMPRKTGHLLLQRPRPECADGR